MRQPKTHPKRSASTAVEVALVLPFALLVILGIFEYGRYFMVRNLMMNAAREGARFAAVQSSSALTSDVQAVVQNYIANQQSQLTSFAITVYPTDSSGNQTSGSWNGGSFGVGVGVQVDGDYKPILPVFLLMPSTVHLTVVAIMNSEGN